MKVLRREIEDALAVRDPTARQRNSREGQWLARQLFLRLFDVIGIEVDVAEGVDKFPGRETDFVSDQARQQSIRCDVERYAQKNVCRRSEENTSELQSLMRISYAVFCLKKKTNERHHHTTTDQKHKD